MGEKENEKKVSGRFKAVLSQPKAEKHPHLSEVPYFKVITILIIAFASITIL